MCESRDPIRGGAVSDSDLMFRSASELAGMVRAGRSRRASSSSSRSARIEELNPRLNAFVEIDGERALAAAAQVAPGDARPFAGVPIAIKNNRAVQGLRLTYGCSLMSDIRGRLRPQHHAPSEGRRLHRGGLNDAARVRHPADQRGAPVRSHAQPLGPRTHPRRLLGRLGGGGGERDGAGRARQRRRRLDPDSRRLLRPGGAQACSAVASPPRPNWASRCSGIDGMLTRTVADTAAILDVLEGYEPGDATWAPPPAEPFAAAAADARPGARCGSPATTLPPIADAVVDPMCAQAVSDAAELLRSLGHTVEEVDPPWRIRGCAGALRGGLLAPTSPSPSPTPRWSPAASPPPRTWSR